MRDLCSFSTSTSHAHFSLENDSSVTTIELQHTAQ